MITWGTGGDSLDKKFLVINLSGLELVKTDTSSASRWTGVTFQSTEPQDHFKQVSRKNGEGQEAQSHCTSSASETQSSEKLKEPPQGSPVSPAAVATSSLRDICDVSSMTKKTKDRELEFLFKDEEHETTKKWNAGEIIRSSQPT